MTPAADALTPGAGNISIGYYTDDLARTITQGSTSTTFTLDSAGRRLVADTTSATGTKKLTRHYTGGGDNPAWTDTTTTTPSGGTATTVSTRYATSIGGDLGADVNGTTGDAQLTLGNPHGDVATTIALPATQSTSTACTAISGWSDTDEYGTPKDTTATTAVAGDAGYGWLGGKQRSTTTETAGLTLMGGRLYSATTGRFTSLDPTPGGNENAHTYPVDPINMSDLDGNMSDPGPGWNPRSPIGPGLYSRIASTRWTANPRTTGAMKSWANMKGRIDGCHTCGNRSAARYVPDHWPPRSYRASRNSQKGQLHHSAAVWRLF